MTLQQIGLKQRENLSRARGGAGLYRTVPVHTSDPFSHTSPPATDAAAVPMQFLTASCRSYLTTPCLRPVVRMYLLLPAPGLL